MFDFLKKKKGKKSDEELDSDRIGLAVNADSLSKHSEAGREFVKAYTGYDGVNDKTLQKSLSGISKSKLNPDYLENNKRQQAGFSAEVLDTARRNKKAILNGDDTRYKRVDDVSERSVNETAFDITAFNSTGEELVDKASQMKFIKYEMDANGNYTNNAEKLTKVITGKVKVGGQRYNEKYPHGRYIVPKDSYDAVKQALKEQEDSLKKQIERAKENGNTELQRKLSSELGYTKKVNKNLVKSELTANEAITARMNPEQLTTREIFSLGHEAGVNYAKTAATISGAMTFARCTNKLIIGEMSPEDAVKEVTIETAKGIGKGYVTAQANTALASVMRNSSKEVLRKMGESSAPAQIVIFATSVVRIVNDRMDGKITDEECFHNIAKSGIGVTGTFNAGIAGQAIGQGIGTQVGGVVGSTMGPMGAIIGSVVAGIIIDSTYDYAVERIKAPGIAREERIELERQCKILHQELEDYRNYFRSTYMANTDYLKGVFGDSLKSMALALDMNDADSFIGGANTITRALRGKTQFETVDEFALFLDSDEAFEL